MSQNAACRLYLMQVGIIPLYEVPVVCYLVQTGDGRNILIDSGLPEIIPEDASEFENGQHVIEQLASIGLTPDDIDTVISTHYDGDHAGRHAAFTKAQYVVQRVHHLDEGFTRAERNDDTSSDAQAIRASTIKLLDLVDRERIGLVIFGHDNEQWQTLRKAPEFYG
jgi:glyoxylase-like metal-dependent hydrolase (beta-lactamase superfamily II)